MKLELERRGWNYFHPDEVLEKHRKEAEALWNESEFDNHRYYGEIRSDNPRVYFGVEVMPNYYSKNKDSKIYRNGGLITWIEFCRFDIQDNGYHKCSGDSSAYKHGTTYLYGGNQAPVLNVINEFCEKNGIEPFEDLVLVDRLTNPMPSEGFLE